MLLDFDVKIFLIYAYINFQIVYLFTCLTRQRLLPSMDDFREVTPWALDDF